MNKEVYELWMQRKAGAKGAHIFTAIQVFVWRSMQHTKNNLVGYIFEAVIGPMIMLLIFTNLFGGAIAGSTDQYINFLLPGILILTVVPMTVNSGTAICMDINKGVYNRLRVMPFWQPASILGPMITDGLRYTIALLCTLAFGLLLGFRAEGGVLGTFAASIFVILFACSVSWIFSMIGVLVKRPETVSGSSMIFIYPLLFASNIFVDSATMPKWIQVIVNVNPISIASSTVRGLVSGSAVITDIALGVGVCLLLIVIFAPMTFYFYLKKSNR